MPRINATLNGKEVDVFYEEQHLIIELDDWHYHQDRQAFNSDHARDAAHRAIGFETIRLTGELLTDAEAVNLKRRLSR
jgi:very-short-patch-repair endonuclease